MHSKHIGKLAGIIVCIVATKATAITLMEINAEWLWDCQGPHEGRVVGDSRPAPTCKEYQEEVDYYAGLIKKYAPDAVALIEIENCGVGDTLAKAIGPRFKSVCRKSRDTYTAQDLAILFNTAIFTPVTGTVTTHPDQYAMDGQKRVRPSKVLSVIANHNKTGDKYLFSGAHLISKTRESNETKRHAQALALRAGVDRMIESYRPDHIVVMGDMNDYPGTQTLINLKGTDLVNPADSDDCSYEHRGNCHLIDHILISRGLAGGEFTDIDVPDKYTDHKPVLYQQSKTN